MGIAEELSRRMESLLMGAMTNQLPKRVQGEPFSFAMLKRTMDALGPPPPPRVGQIIESIHMVDRHEDWSNVRSPSRTLRRMRYNASRIYTYTPKKEALQMPDGSLVMHPVMAAQLRKLTDQQ